MRHRPTLPPRPAHRGRSRHPTRAECPTLLIDTTSPHPLAVVAPRGCARAHHHPEPACPCQLVPCQFTASPLPCADAVGGSVLMSLCVREKLRERGVSFDLRWTMFGLDFEMKMNIPCWNVGPRVRMKERTTSLNGLRKRLWWDGLKLFRGTNINIWPNYWYVYLICIIYIWYLKKISIQLSPMNLAMSAPVSCYF